MRVLRQSAFADPGLPPLTTVMRDRDLKDTLESVRQSGLRPELLVISDIFEMPDDTIERATFAALERIDVEREQNMALLYFWDLRQLRIVRPEGTLTTNKPSPLSTEEIRVVLDQIASHPLYENQTIVVHDEEMNPVTLKRGKLDG